MDIKDKCKYYMEAACENCADVEDGDFKTCCYHCTKLSCISRCKILKE